MAKTRVMRCKCVHKYQDKKYGKKRRLHNEKDPRGRTPGWRCTVCGESKSNF